MREMIRFAMLINFLVAGLDYACCTEFKLIPDQCGTGDQFGYTVSISGDFAMVGAPYDDDNGNESGSVYIFQFDGSTWVEQQKLIYDGAQGNDRFGYSVCISGNHAIVGAPFFDDRSGAAYVFHYNGCWWEEPQKLTASDGAENDYFGYRVSLSGENVIIGAIYESENAYHAGAAYVFHYNGCWWEEQQKLIASNGEMNDYFGDSVSISGDNAIIGAYHHNYQGVYEKGAAYIFHFNGFRWEEVQMLLPIDGSTHGGFGQSVSISGEFAAVGRNADERDRIVVQTYFFNGSGWEEHQKLLPSDYTWDGGFGDVVSILGDYLIVGAYKDNDNGLSSGSAYIFSFDGLIWEEQQKLTASDGDENDYFGWSVSISGGNAIAGAKWDDDNGLSSGSAYIFSGIATPAFTPTVNPSPTATPSPMPSVTSTPSPNPCSPAGVTLWMNSHFYRPGDPCGCTLTICNPGSASLENYPLFVLLQIEDIYFFAPSFSTSVDSYIDSHPSFEPGLTGIEVLHEFKWPQNAGNAEGIRFISALLNPDQTEAYGDVDTWEFGWGE